MATSPSSSSTCVDIDAPDALSISTPIWPLPVQTQTFPGLPPCAPTMYNISTPHSFTYPGTQVQMLSTALGGSSPVQPLSWPSQHDSMQICLSMDVTSRSVAQHDLPGIFSTPGQVKPVNELTLVLKASCSEHENQISDLAAKVESNNQQVVTLMTAAKQQEAAEADQLIKAVQLMITKEIQKNGTILHLYSPG
ncbi:hypothetical protein M9458_054572 [Cirrhinus mrigala]|uniref:Uncharacterized protein n=1 Tax=Cirrhinus mrigala TaxID=683832 RepID=A0ABD0MKH6_CIRMR